MKNRGNYLLNLMIEESTLEKNITTSQINLIECPCGAGKTTWVLDYIARNYYNTMTGFDFINNASKVLYIIDTRNNREKVMNEYMERIDEMYDDDFLFKPYLDEMTFKKVISGGITIETYAYVSVKAKQEPSYFQQYELIICDELHTAFKFEHNKPFLNSLPFITESKIVIAISATPRLIYGNYHEVVYDVLGKHKHQLQNYEQDTIEEFMDISLYLETNRFFGEKTLIYTQRITDEENIKTLCQNLGYKVEFICSESNEKFKSQQQRLKDYLIEFEEIPEELDVLIVNATFETGLNLRNVDNVICNSTDEDTNTQALGRARCDVKLYAHKYTTESEYNEQKIYNLIESYAGQKLFKEQQQELFDGLYELGICSKRKEKLNTMKAINKWLMDNLNCEYEFISKKESKGEHRQQRYIFITL